MIERSNDQNTCMNCTKKGFSLICNLSYGELETLEKTRTIVNYKTGETIYKEGLNPFGLICLNSGKVKIVISGEKEKEIIVELKKPVDFLGFTEMMADEKYTTRAVALVDSSVCIIDKSNFLKVLQGNPELSMKVMAFLAKELSLAHRKTIILSQKQLKARLAEALLELFNSYGVDNSDGKTLNTLLRRDDLSSLSGMTIASASRTLAEFKREGIISLKGRKIKIIDKKKLEEICSN